MCAAKSPTNQRGSLICGDNDYVAMSGTSAAAPMVAAEIALLIELAFKVGHNPSLSQLTDAIIEGDEKVFSGDPDFFEGYGRINMRKAGKYFCPDCVIDVIKERSGGGCLSSTQMCSMK